MKSKLIICIICLAGVLIAMNSCNSKEGKKDSGKEEHSEEAYNDSIQGTFFGVSFGAGRDEVIEKFAEKGLYLDNRISTNNDLHFYTENNKRFTFGGRGWEHLQVGMSNGRFFFIDFYNSFKDKVEAIRDGEHMNSSVSKKYNLVRREPKDSTLYYLFYYGLRREKPRRLVCIYVNRYESLGKEILYGVHLNYIDYANKAEFSEDTDEL